jgi:hypothetical protein
MCYVDRRAVAAAAAGNDGDSGGAGWAETVEIRVVLAVNGSRPFQDTAKIPRAFLNLYNEFYECSIWMRAWNGDNVPRRRGQDMNTTKLEFSVRSQWEAGRARCRADARVLNSASRRHLYNEWNSAKSAARQRADRENIGYNRRKFQTEKWWSNRMFYW